MNRTVSWAAAALVGALAIPSQAADHRDGPAVVADPTADIADVYVWMSEAASQVHLVMTIGRNFAAGAAFSDSVQYVFHTISKGAFLDAGGLDTDVICEFDASQRVSCWAGTEAYVTGDASSTTGISSSDGRLRVFAGLRNNPFFFNLEGFQTTAAAVTATAPSLAFDSAGCPALDAATATALVTQLKKTKAGTAAVDNFGGEDTLALVLVVDKGILTKGGPIVGVSGATYRR